MDVFDIVFLIGLPKCFSGSIYPTRCSDISLAAVKEWFYMFGVLSACIPVASYLPNRLSD